MKRDKKELKSFLSSINERLSGKLVNQIFEVSRRGFEQWESITDLVFCTDEQFFVFSSIDGYLCFNVYFDYDLNDRKITNKTLYKYMSDDNRGHFKQIKLGLFENTFLLEFEDRRGIFIQPYDNTVVKTIMVGHLS